jgi:hypothetical protein
LLLDVRYEIRRCKPILRRLRIGERNMRTSEWKLLTVAHDLSRLGNNRDAILRAHSAGTNDQQN